MATRRDVAEQCDIYWCEAGCGSKLPRTHKRFWPASGLTLTVVQRRPGRGSANGMQEPYEFILVERGRGPFDRAAMAQADADQAEAQELRRWCLEWEPTQL